MLLYKTATGVTNRQLFSGVLLSEPFEAVLQRLGDVAFDCTFRNTKGIRDFILGKTVDPVQQEDMTVDGRQFIECGQTAPHALASIEGDFGAGSCGNKRIKIDFMLNAVIACLQRDTAIRSHIGSHAVEIRTRIFQRTLVGVLKNTKIGVLNDIGSFVTADPLPHKCVQLAGMQQVKIS